MNLGKTQLWNRGGVFPLGCEPLIRTAQASDPDAIVWRGCADLPVHQQGIRVLGTPLGQPEFVVEQLSSLFEKIPAVQDLQCAWLLLLFCASTRARKGLLVHDTRVWECSSELLGVQAEGAPRNIAHLPFRHGGLGLASAVLSRSACWASWADCLPMIKARHLVIAGEMLHALDDQRGGIHVNSASSGWDSPTELDHVVMMIGRMCPASIVHGRLAESIWPGLTESQRVLLRSQGGHGEFSIHDPSSVIPCEV